MFLIVVLNIAATTSLLGFEKPIRTINPDLNRSHPGLRKRQAIVAILRKRKVLLRAVEAIALCS